MATQESTNTKTQDCPVCQTTLPVHDEYVTWCDQCGWNVNPHQPEKPRNVFESAYASLGQKQSRALLKRFVRAEDLKPAFSVSKLLALALAAAIHGFTLMFAIGGLGLLINGWPNLFAIVAGLLCLGAAWILRPRVAKAPDTVVCRKDFPTLYKLVDAVADALQTKAVGEIAVDERFSAAFGQIGWQRKSILHLGLPLWSILDDQERIALVAHELAHGVNGDFLRGFFVGTAVNALGEWYVILRPDHIWPPGSGIQGLVMAPFNVILLGLATLAWLGAYGLSHLLWRDCQRAEYLADHLAASVSGAKVMLSLLQKLHFTQTFEVVLSRAALGKDANCDFFAELQQRVRGVPQRELERIKRVEQLETSRLDTTHPPTAYRIELLQSHQVSHPQIEFPTSDFEQLEEELSSIKSKIQQRLVDKYKASLYSS